MRKLAFILGAVLLMSSCTNEEALDPCETDNCFIVKNVRESWSSTLQEYVNGVEAYRKCDGEFFFFLTKESYEKDETYCEQI